jgi:N6-L-threonylcarbamoyladenine synthase
MLVSGVGRYTLLGETLDDAAGEAFDKTAQLLGLGYPGGPALSKLAASGDASRFTLPRPMLNSGDFDFSFSGLKTAVLTLVRKVGLSQAADIAAAFQSAAVDVLVSKSLAACTHSGATRLVVAGGVGANAHLRERLTREPPHARHQRVLSAAGILHRQRRDDRLRRRAAAGEAS